MYWIVNAVLYVAMVALFTLAFLMLCIAPILVFLNGTR